MDERMDHTKVVQHTDEHRRQYDIEVSNAEMQNATGRLLVTISLCFCFVFFLYLLHEEVALHTQSTMLGFVVVR